MPSPDWTTARLVSTASPSPVTWLVEEYIPANTVTLLSSISGSGKSVIALHLGLCLLAGNEWLGIKCRQSSFGYWDQDNPDPWLTDNRICAIKRGLGLDILPSALVFRTSGRVLGTAHKIMELILWLKDNGVTVLFVDTLASVNPYPENDPNMMARCIVDNFFPMVDAGITPIILHHIGKDTMDNKGNSHRRKGIFAPRGSTALMAAVGAAFNLDKGADGTRSLECVKPRYGHSPTLVVGYDEEGYIGSPDWRVTITTPERRESRESLTQFINQNGYQNVSSRKLVELLRMRGRVTTQSSAARALSESK